MSFSDKWDKKRDTIMKLEKKDFQNIVVVIGLIGVFAGYVLRTLIFPGC